VTTDPMPTMENSPSVTPRSIVALAPIVTPRQTRVWSVSSVGSDVSSPESRLPVAGTGRREDRVRRDHAKSSIVTAAQM
jgi:hypothetical protein